MKLGILFCMVLLLCAKLEAQFSTIDIMEESDHIEIPFEYEQGFIVIKVFLNGVLPLNFIFDTGAENTVLFKKQYAEIMGLPMNEKIKIIGSDRSRTQIGYIARRIPFKLIHGGLFKMDIVVLDDSEIDFTNLIGREIDGILGANMLLGSIVEINYKRKYLKFYRQEKFKPPRRHYKEDIAIIKQRPFVKSTISIDGENDFDIQLLFDTGAAIHLLIDEESHEDLIMPDTIIDSRIGSGLGGGLAGFIGTISKLDVMKNNLRDARVYFQRQDTLFLNQIKVMKIRNGIIGNVFLERHHVILDYNKKILYHRPFKKAKKPFRFNKSGLIVFAVGPDLDEYIIKYVIPNSAGDLAGVKQGDVIKSINFIPHSFLDMTFIHRIFSKEEGKRIRLKLKRDGKTEIIKFELFNKKVTKEIIE